MDISRRIARILGPTLVALGVTEGLNIDRFDGNPAPVVFLDGTVLFVAGLAILQAHNRWVRSWPVLVTFAGWSLIAGGLYRMVAPAAPQAGADAATYGVLAVLVVVGAVLSVNGYRREAASRG